METKIIKATDKAINNAAKMIQQGEIVAFPTETVYGLGANAFDVEACKKIYEAKGRPIDKPLSLLVANRTMIDEIANVSSLAETLINKFMPGAITLILPKLKKVPDFVTCCKSSVGVRMPDNDIALKLIKAANCPIAAPSANLSGKPSPTNAQAVYDNLKGRIPLIIDGGSCTFGVDSTIVDLTGDKPIILREGAIEKDILINYF